MDSTIVYYTSNAEDETFERRIRENILCVSGGLPIVSVSRKPIDFGENICVGEYPVCYPTQFRQIREGLRAVKTPFAIAAESDVLYPPEYFQYVPPLEDRVYRYANIWVLYLWNSRRFYGKFWQKGFTEGAQMCGVQRWIEAIDEVVDDDWNNCRPPDKLIFTGGLLEYRWTSDNPVLTMKTGRGVSRYTTKAYTSSDKLPYWGTIEDVKGMLK